MPPKRRTTRAVAQKTSAGDGDAMAEVKNEDGAEDQTETTVNGNEVNVADISTEEGGGADNDESIDWAADSVDESFHDANDGEPTEETEDKATENGDNGDKKEDEGDVKKEEGDKEADKSRETTGRRQFWTEFEVEVRGLPKMFGKPIGLKNLLNTTLKLDAKDVRVVRQGSHFAFASFENEEKRDKALQVLNSYHWRGRDLFAVKAKPRRNPPGNKRKLEEGGSDGDAKKPKKAIPVSEDIQEKCTPLASQPYEDQLKVKRENLTKTLVRIADLIKLHNRHIADWVKEQREKFENMLCELTEVKPSPVTDGYRNKSDLTIGVNPETQEWTVGCRLSTYRGASAGVGPIELLKHMPQAMKDAAKLVEKFIRDSKKPPYDPEERTGYWRQLTVRTTDEGSLMLIIACHPQDMKPEELTEMKEKLKDFFESGEGKEANVTSLYFQSYGKKENNSTTPLEHLFGDKYVWETVKGLKFRISPESFFQVNTAGADTLFDAILELAPVSGEETALVDLCCGTGAIGLSLSKSFGQILGIEMNSQTMEDAQFNATSNEITNCEFVEGKAETVLKSALEKVTKPDVLVAVDPPRPGLHPKTISILRTTPSVKHLVYVTCDLQSSIRNFLDLCRGPNKNHKGHPFVPVKAIPVDLFPHTPHCETAILFERRELPDLAEKEAEDDKSELRGDSGNRRWRRGGLRRGSRGGSWRQQGGRDDGARHRDRDLRLGGQDRRRMGAPRGRFGRDEGMRRGHDRRFGGMDRAGFGRQGGHPPPAFYQERNPEGNGVEPVFQEQRMAFAMEALRRFDEEMERRRTAEELVIRANRPPLMPPKARGINRHRMPREDFTRDTLPRYGSFDSTPRPRPRGGRPGRNRM